MSKIISLQAENFKRLKAVEISPDKDGNLVIISGRNEQGKSSVLDSIMAALGGKDAVPDEPIRRGTKSAKIKLDLGDMIVERKFNADNTYLKITAKDGTDVKSPQALLDKLVGKLSFDPLEFVNLKGEEQQKILKTLTGLDFTALEKKKDEAYQSRTNTNRDLVNAKARLSKIPEVEAAEEEVSVVELTAQLTAANDTNAINEDVRDDLKNSNGLLKDLGTKKEGLEADARQDEKAYQKEIDRLKKEHEEEVERFKREITAVDERIEKGFVLVKKLEKQVESLKDVDTDSITKAITDSQETNRLVRQKKDRALLVSEVEKLSRESDRATRLIDGIDADKERLISEAAMPIKGLAFDESGITFKGIPFKQISSSEKLRVGLAMSIALNPKIRVVLVRDASLLDSGNLAILKDFADKNNVQIWLEKVDETGKIGIVIEDGEIVEPKEEKE